MPTPIVAPDAGQTTDEMTLVRWYVAPGDQIAVGDFVADLETDKAVLELESAVAGTVLALMAEVGETVVVGQTLAWVGAPGEEPPQEQPDAPAPEAVPCPQPESLAARSAHGHLLASPAARSLARERDLDLTALTGTGPGGCLVQRDVLEASAAGERVPLSPMRQAIARRLQASVREAPHFYVAMDVDMTRALAFREALDPKPTITDVVVSAAAQALREFPQVNAWVEGDAIRRLAQVNIGIAVSVDEGLLVPVLADADSLTLPELAAQTRALIAEAREGRLSTGPRAGFTVSNLGMMGVKWFTAIINPPEAAILAVGAVEQRLVLRGGQVTALQVVELVLSADHRAVDGALAARFLAAVKARLERAGTG
jgi:pyruvate dehydrogenase E2 component (dihydrolipoamide acetyltransferase)